MAAISVDRVIRSLDRYSENELTKLRRAVDDRLGRTSNQISEDDLEVFQAGTSGAINKMREQRDRYQNQLEFYEEYFPKKWIAYINGKDVHQGQTQVGIALMLHEGGENTEVRLIEGLSPSTLEETRDNVTTALFNAIGLIPEAADMGNQGLDGLERNDWQQIFLAITHFRYTESLKSQFSEKQAELFGRYYPQIQPNYANESRSTVQTRFNMIISRTFEKRERRANKTRFIVEKIGE